MPFEIFRSEKTAKFYFRLKAKNSQVIMQSEAYEQKAGVKNAIESVQKNAADKDNFDIRTAKDGRKYFVLKARNGEIIGRSQMYKSRSGLSNGIKSVTTNAKLGEIVDKTKG